MKTKLLPVVVALALTASLAACGDDDDDAGGADTTAALGTIEVTDAWARTSPTVATRGAVYMTITNGADVDDALVGASVAADVAARTELHETVAVEEPMSPSTSADGDMSDDGMGDDGELMEMREVDEIPVPAGGTATLEPGGYHVMLLDLAEPLVEGAVLEVTLEFERAGTVVVEAEVRADAP
jgi:copper(I)-binding protein